MKKFLYTASIVLFLAMIITACGSSGSGGDSGNGDNAGNSNGPDSAQVSAVLTSLQSKLDPLFQSDTEPTLDQIKTAMESVPGMVFISADDLEVIGKIGADGPIIYVTLPPPAGLYDPALDPALKLATTRQSVSTLKSVQKDILKSGASVSLPDKTNVVLLNGLGGDTFKDVTPEIKNIFTKYYATPNYTVNRYDASITNLKAVVYNVDVLFIKTHGYKFSASVAPTSDSEKLSTYTLTSSTRVNLNDPSPSVYKADIDKHNIVFVYAPTEKEGIVFKNYKYEWLYGITAGFVNDYWHINTDGLAFICACSSASAQADTFRGTVYEKGASGYIGWSAPIDSDFADHRAKYVFDRILGSNSFSPPSPNQRAFSYLQVQQELLSRNMITWPGQGNFKPSTMKFQPNPANDNFGLLAPSIKYMEIDEKNDSSETPVLTIYGTFGKKEGKVYLINDSGENLLTVDSWSEEEIKCLLPPDDAGDIVVEVNDVKGNKRRISKWTGKVTFTVEPKTLIPKTISSNLKDTVTWDLKVRADIGNYRNGSGQQPQERTVKYGVTKKSEKTTFSSSGSWVMQGDDGPKTILTWTGGGTSKIYSTSGNDANYCAFRFDTGQKQLKMNIYFVGEAGTKIVTFNPGTPAEQKAQANISTLNTSVYDEKSPYTMPPYYIINVNFDENWNIEAGEKAVEDLSYSIGANSWTVKFKWDAMSVKYPPVDDVEHGR